MQLKKLMPLAMAAALILAACSSPAAAPTTAPAAPAATEIAATEAPAAATEATVAPTEAAMEATVAPTEAMTSTEAMTATEAMTSSMAMTSTSEIDNIVLSPDKPTEITFLSRYSGGQYTAVLEITNDFNANNPYGIKVNLETVSGSYNDLYNKINSQLQGGTPPALAQAYQNQASFYRNQDAVVNLAPYIASAKYGLTAEDLADYYPAFLESDKNPQYSGEVLGWPTARSIDVLYTNLDWLQTLGATAPPATLKEFEDLACKASNADEKKYGYMWRGDASDFAALVFANGGRVLAPDASAYVFNSPEAVEVLTMLKRMFENGCATVQPQGEMAQSYFANQSILFSLESSTGLPFFARAIGGADAKFKWAYSMFPQKDAAAPKTNMYGASWSMFKTTPEQQLASWLYLKAFTEKDNIVKWAKASNYLSVRKSAATDAIAAVKENTLFTDFPEAAEGYAKLYDMVQYSLVEAPVAGYDPVRALIQDTVAAVAVNGEGEPQAALDDAVSQANDILAENAPVK